MRWTLWKRLMVSFLALGLPPVLVAGYLVQRDAARSLEENVLQSLNAVTNQKVWLVENYMRDRDSDLRLAVARPATLQVLEAAARGRFTPAERELATNVAQSVVEAYDYDDAMILDSQGKVLARSPGRALIGTNLFETGAPPELRNLLIEMQAGSPSVTRDYFDARTGRRVAWLSRPVIARGRRLGFMLLHLNFERLFPAVTAESGAGRTEETLLVSLNERRVEFLAPPRLPRKQPPLLHLGDPVGTAAQRAATGQQGSGFAVDDRGVPVAAVYRPLPSLGWGIVVKIDRAEVFAPIDRLRFLTVAIGAGALLLVVLLGWLIAHSISRPLKQLRATAERVADGDFEQQVGVLTSNDEVGDLSRAFSAMVARLKQWAELTRTKERLEAELRDRAVIEELSGQLEQSRHLAGLARVATAMAHEFNNVLMTIQALNDVTRRRGTFEQFTSSLPTIEAAIQRGKQITAGVRRLTEAASISMEPIDLGPWLRELAVELRAIVDPSIEVRVSPTPDVGHVWADRLLLREVIESLVRNARDAMRGRGVLSITAHRGQAPDGVEPAVTISVSDDAGAIAPADRVRIFEPFFSNKPGGAGLGLSVAHAIVTAHNGQLTVDSVPGTRTTFKMTLRGALPPDAKRSLALVPPAPASQHVLFVEDDDTVAAGISMLLELDGFEVTRTATAAAALAALHDITPDLLLLDIRLPDSDGVTLYRRIESIAGPLPVVFATGHGDREQLDEFRDRPNVAFLSKPFGSADLREAMARVTEQAGKAAEEAADGSAS